MDELQKQIDDLKSQINQLIKDEFNLTYRQQLRMRNAYQGTKVYYVATGPTGPYNTPIKFKDGIFTSETGPTGTP